MNKLLLGFVDRFKQKKDKVSLLLSFIILALVAYGLVVFVGMYISGFGANAGFIEISGRIEGYEYHAGTKTGGLVSEMLVKEGDTVEAGQVIARLSSEQLQAALAAAQSDFNLAEEVYTRQARLYKEKAIAKMEFDAVRNQYTLAKEKKIAAEAAVNDTEVKAPIAGIISLKIVQAGEVVAAGTPLVTIINMNDLYLNVFLPTDVAGKIKVRDEARVYPDALPKDSFPAVVDEIAAKAEFTPKDVETKIQREKLVFRIKLRITDNKNQVLKPGMPSDGVIRIDERIPWSKYKR